MCQIYYSQQETHQKGVCCIYCQLSTYFVFYFTVIITEFEQTNACWIWEYIVSDNKFVFSNYEKYIALWLWKFFGLHVCINIHPK